MDSRPGGRAARTRIVLLGYAALAHFARRALSDRTTIRIAYWCGALGAIVLIPTLLIEYLGKTVNNGVVVAAVVAIWFLSGFFGSRPPGGILSGVWSATISAMVGSLANVSALLCSYYALRGTDLQETFFRTERAYDDFAQSGTPDFGLWAMQDLFGGAFFHLLFGALIGAILGLLGGIVRLIFGRLLPRVTQ